MKYKVGDRVRLVSKRSSRWNEEGEMDKFINKVVILTDINDEYETIKFEGIGNWSILIEDIVGYADTDKFYVILSDNMVLREAQSRVLQEIAFKVGYLWNKSNTGQDIKHLDAMRLSFSVWNSNELTCGSNDNAKALKMEGAIELTVEEALEQLSKPKQSEFKVGDWVAWFPENDIINPHINQIKEWTSHSYCKMEDGNKPFKPFIKRLATEEEIVSAQRLVIATHIVKYDFNITEIGCESHHNSDWVQLVHLLQQFSITEVLHSSGDKVQRVELEQLVRKLKS